jgi:class 3 adenylate cyclase
MSELPSGAVTFLFTDVEGSTRLLKQLLDRDGEVLTEQGRLLRDVVARHGGRVVDTQGDSFFVAFASAGGGARRRRGAALAGRARLAVAVRPDRGSSESMRRSRERRTRGDT